LLQKASTHLYNVVPFKAKESHAITIAEGVKIKGRNVGVASWAFALVCKQGSAGDYKNEQEYAFLLRAARK
jgi:hypothetical protein